MFSAGVLSEAGVWTEIRQYLNVQQPEDHQIGSGNKNPAAQTPLICWAFVWFYLRHLQDKNLFPASVHVNEDKLLVNQRSCRMKMEWSICLSDQISAPSAAGHLLCLCQRLLFLYLMGKSCRRLVITRRQSWSTRFCSRNWT